MTPSNPTNRAAVAIVVLACLVILAVILLLPKSAIEFDAVYGEF